MSYNGTDYILVWLYESGFCEIQQAVGKKVVLVHISEIPFIENKETLLFST